MAYKVLIVDDSVTFRAAIRAALEGESDVQVVGTAANGLIALAKLREEKIDIVTLDLEMPDMDGLQVLEEIKKENLPVKVIIFASQTTDRYEQVRSAFALGASDIVPKPISTATGDPAQAIQGIKDQLVPRIKLVIQSVNLKAATSLTIGGSSIPLSPVARPSGGSWEKKLVSTLMPRAIVIASSTGGPIALEHLFQYVKGRANVPIFIAQHMPPPFTKNLADKIGEITGLKAAEGVDGEVVAPGKIYVAPGDYHMFLESSNGSIKIRLNQGPRINYVRPAADPLFETASGIYRDQLVAFVLTGMGEDGKDGAIAVKNGGGSVMIQDQATSVVWGMPGAVFEAQAYDEVAPIDQCASTLAGLLVKS